MENDLLSISRRYQEIVGRLIDGIPFTNYDAEMVILDILTSELLESMGYDVTSIDGRNHPRHKELKTALMNMFFLGQTNGKNIYSSWEPQSEAERFEKAEEWISVEDRLPPLFANEMSERVLVVNKRGEIDLEYYDYEFGRFTVPFRGVITHWMPLPKPPERSVE